MNNLQNTEEIIALTYKLSDELQLSKKNNDEYIINMTNELLKKLKLLKQSLEE